MKRSDVEAIGMMYREDIEKHVHATQAVPYRRLFTTRMR